jgi:ABC-type branched-subunit amino acid transport system ATPase component
VTEHLLELRNVSVRFGGLQALDDVSLTVPRGEIRAVIGPNGSGKTTLLNAISGFVRLARGEILLDGRAIHRLPSHRRVQAGLARTFQSASVFGELDLIDNVRVGLHRTDPHSLIDAFIPGRNERLSAETRRTAMDHLRAVGLDTHAASLADSLAYGQQRLLDFARAAATKPALILLDEPTAGLNSTEIERLRGDIRRLRDLNTTVVLIEHHMPFVMDLCDTVTVLNFGRVIASGRPAEVRADPAVVASYLGTRGAKP